MVRSRPHGTSLIITIFFITIIVMVAIGLMSSASVDRNSSRAFLERIRATEFARTGIEQTIGILQKETAYRFKVTTSDDSDRYYNRHYITEPGMLIVPEVPTPGMVDADLQASQSQLKEVRYLSTQSPKVEKHANAIFNAANLNIETFDSDKKPTYLLSNHIDPATEKPSEMRLKWIYVRQNRGEHPTDPKKWTEELDDGGASEEPFIDPKRPIIGRYAYWTDDESSKINYNLAWKRNEGIPNTAKFASPTRINLTVMGINPNMADAIHNYTTITPNRFFNSFADARQVAATEGKELTDFLDQNKFDLTHFNHDPDTTFFGEDRILLTTNRLLVPSTLDPVTKKQKYARKFLDIMRDDKSPTLLDPGILEDIAGGQQDWRIDGSGKTLVQGGLNKFDAVVRDLIRYIGEKNWPLSPGVTFQKKYYPGSTPEQARVAQLAVNIIDYVRAKESPQPFIAPMRFALGVNPTTNQTEYTLHTSVAYGQENSFQGVCRGPYITEMGFSIAKNKTTKEVGTAQLDLYECTFKTELFLPPKYKIPGGINLWKPTNESRPLKQGTSDVWFLMYTTMSDDREKVGDKTNTFYYFSETLNKVIAIPDSDKSYAEPIFPEDIKGPHGTTLMPGDRVTITKTFYRNIPWKEKTYATTMRCALYHGIVNKNGLLDSASRAWPRINIAPQARIPDLKYNISNPDSDFGSADKFQSIEVDDPRCNVSNLDWKPNLKGQTFGAPNTILSVGNPAKKLKKGGDPAPQQDADEAGNISDYSLYMPPPKIVGGDADDDNGVVTSIGELGWVLTGNDANDGSIPWRTIRLQPNYFDDSKILPDWAFMDLFGVPNTGSVSSDKQAIYTPHGTSVGGRVNVNAHVSPFTKMERTGALLATVTGATGVTGVGKAVEVAQNIYARTLATGSNFGKTYGYPATVGVKNPGPNDSNAYDTPGEICEIKGVADKGEASEELLREIASLITARGGVFGIYTVGQALQQTPSGKLVVTGEQRQHAIVERYVDSHKTLDTADDEVRFRTIYFRNLSP